LAKLLAKLLAMQPAIYVIHYFLFRGDSRDHKICHWVWVEGF
jgi:hypothetical protein